VGLKKMRVGVSSKVNSNLSRVRIRFRHVTAPTTGFRLGWNPTRRYAFPATRFHAEITPGHWLLDEQSNPSEVDDMWMTTGLAVLRLWMYRDYDARNDRMDVFGGGREESGWGVGPKFFFFCLFGLTSTFPSGASCGV